MNWIRDFEGLRRKSGDLTESVNVVGILRIANCWNMSETRGWLKWV